MDVKEIQIGDWIKYVSYLNEGDNPPYITNIQIKNIYGNEINCKTRDYTILSGTHLLGCEPIQLTEELLLKNGFEHDDIYLVNNDIMIFFGEHILFSFYDDKAAECTIDNFTIKYVHELQHLLRFCGLNDLADNFKIE